MDIIMDKNILCKKKGEAATSCLSTEGIYAVFCLNTIQTVLQAVCIWKKKIQREQKETIHIQKLYCDSYLVLVLKMRKSLAISRSILSFCK